MSVKNGLADKLPFYRPIDEGILLNKSGSLTASLTYRGEDLDSSSDDERNGLKDALNRALMQFGTNWAIHTECLCIEKNQYPEMEDCAFPDPTSFVMDQERRERHKQSKLHYERKYFVTFTYLPPNDIETKIADIVIVGREQKVTSYQAHIRRFKQMIATFIRNMGTKLNLEMLNTNELYSYISCAITDKYLNLSLFGQEVDWDYLLGKVDVSTTLNLRVGNEWVKALTIVDFPERTRPAMLQALSQLKFRYKWVTRYLPMDKADADIVLRRRTKTYFGKRDTAKQIVAKGVSAAGAPPNPDSIGNVDAEIYANESKNAIRDNALGKEKFGYYTSVIIVRDSDEAALDEKIKIIQRVVNDAQIDTIEEDIGAYHAFLGAIPGDTEHNLRIPILGTKSLCDLLPLNSVWSGLTINPNPLLSEIGVKNPPHLQCVTTGAQPFSFSHSYGNNCNALLIGPSVIARNIYMNLFAAQAFKYDYAKVYIFDANKGSMPLCCGVGGQFYDIGNQKNEVNFQPLRELETPNQFQLAKTFIKLLCEIKVDGFKGFNNEEDKAVGDVLELLQIKALNERTLTEFTILMKPKYPIISQAVEYFTQRGGHFGKLFDSNNVENNFTAARMASFELGYIQNHFGDEALIPLIVYIFNKLRIELFPKRFPIFIIITGVWKAMATPKFVHYLQDILRTGPANNVSLTLATDEPTDITESSLRSLLLSNCPTKIYLPNYAASSDLIRPAYRSLGLNNKQISIISSAADRRQFYYTSPYGRRLFELDICDFTRCFVENHNMELAEQLYLQDKSMFAFNWVTHFAKKHNNLNLGRWANYWLEVNSKFNSRFTRFNDGQY